MKRTTDPMATREAAATNLEVRATYRYSKDSREDEPTLDGLPNFHFVTKTGSSRRVMLESGINPVKEVRSGPNRRRLAICIRTSPGKAGTVHTPWHDVFDLESGRAIYFGDHKRGQAKALGSTTGNKVLREAWELHHVSDSAARAAAPPILCFRTVGWTNELGHANKKGAVEFLGIARITNATEIVATDPIDGESYPNMMFELALVDLPGRPAALDWAWIRALRDGSRTLEECESLAPTTWRQAL